MADNNTCYICLGEGSEDQPLIHPCYCKFVHRDCLNQWRAECPDRHFWVCEVCRYEYRIQRLWWGKVLGHPLTSVGLTLTSMVGGTMGSGWISSLAVNAMWLWWKIFANWLNHQSHLVVETPPWSGHRMQVLFHGLFWMACLGIYQLIKSLRQADGPNIDWNVVHNRPGVVYRPIYISSPSPSLSEEKKEESKRSPRDKSNKSKKPDTPWTYTSPSATAWVAVLSGAAVCSYHVYHWFRKRCSTWCQEAQEYIENVRME